jgi:hypothetical protein
MTNDHTHSHVLDLVRPPVQCTAVFRKVYMISFVCVLLEGGNRVRGSVKDSSNGGATHFRTYRIQSQQ